MSTLLFPACGIQSCGSRSLYEERETGTEPSKSQIVGLICAAMGVERGDGKMIAKIAALRMGVRVDVSGVAMTDFSTAGGGKPATMTITDGPRGLKLISYGVAQSDGDLNSDPNKRAAITRKHYLSDACFLVALEGDDDLVKTIHDALGNPVFGLSLGRKCFKPTMPMKLKDGIKGEAIEAAFRSYPWLPEVSAKVVGPSYWFYKQKKQAESNGLRAVIEVVSLAKRDLSKIKQLFDVPVTFTQEKRLTSHLSRRYVSVETVEFPKT